MSAGAQTLNYKPFYLRIRLPDGQIKNIHDLDPYSTLDELMLEVSVSSYRYSYKIDRYYNLI